MPNNSSTPENRSVRERPILFSAPMVRAILAGTKTQTRRVVKMPHGFWETTDDLVLRPIPVGCRYGQPGDRLYVRETWANATKPLHDPFYRADGEALGRQNPFTYVEREPRWRPSIHMPRWASRIDLEIAGVRVERLNAISEADAIAEGVESLDSDAPEERTHHDFDRALCSNCGGLRLYMGGGLNGVTFDMDCMQCDTHAKRFSHLWESINGAGSWDENPWVWVVEFKRVAP